MPQTISISSRFKGPPNSVNGGYACGVMALEVAGYGGGAVEAALMAPPPLETELAIKWSGDGVEMFFGDKVVGRAAPASLDLNVPSLPNPLKLGISPFDLPGARGKFRPFDTCFVCGDARRPGDGLCIHSKTVEGTEGLVASKWVLDDSLSGADGMVDPVFLWSALDCPGYFACAAGEAALLGKLTGKLIKPLPLGGEATVIGWDLMPDKSGRKRRCGTAIYSADGELVAYAEGIWVVIDPTKMPNVFTEAP